MHPVSSVIRWPSLIALAAPVLFMGCHREGPVEPLAPDAGRLAIVLGDLAADTTTAVLSQALTIEVRDASDLPVPGATVRFEGLVAAPGYPPSLEASVRRLDGSTGRALAVDTTDANGRARAVVQLGTRPGSARIVIRVPTLGFVDTAHYTVRAGNPTSVQFNIRDTLIGSGGQYTLGGSAFDRWGNPRPDVVLSYASRSGVASVSSAGRVTGAMPGRGTIVAKADGALVDSAYVSVVPNFTLAVVWVGKPGTNVTTLRLDGSALDPLTPVTSSVILPSTSAAGVPTVFTEGEYANARIYAVNAQRVRSLIVDTTANLTAMSQPRIAADGQWIYFTGTLPFNYPSYGSVIWRVHADGTGLEQLTPAGASQTSHSMPSPSPDGTKVVFVNGGSLAVLNLATKAITPLPVRGTFPHYSPDGTKIVYVANSKITIANADGSAPTPVFVSRSYDIYAVPDWSPDGQWIIARGAAGLELGRIADGLLIPLPFSGGMYQPSFRPTVP